MPRAKSLFPIGTSVVKVLARSTRDLLNTLDAIGKAGATFKSLTDQWAETTTPHGRLMLTVLGGLAEFERHLILSRTAEGRSRAQANGVRFGRKPALTAYQRAEALRRRAAGETLTEIAQLFGVRYAEALERAQRFGLDRTAPDDDGALNTTHDKSSKQKGPIGGPFHLTKLMIESQSK
jgi:DNA invertase Pin-like site-specific DNA recombinase